MVRYMSEGVTTVTVTDIIAKVREIAAAEPDFMYPQTGGTCTYNESSPYDDVRTPQCIFGKALTQLGIPVPDQFEGRGIQTVLVKMNIPFTEEQEQWMRIVQGHQDDHVPWGHAVQAADNVWPGVV